MLVLLVVVLFAGGDVDAEADACFGAACFGGVSGHAVGDGASAGAGFGGPIHVRVVHLLLVL